MTDRLTRDQRRAMSLVPLLRPFRAHGGNVDRHFRPDGSAVTILANAHRESERKALAEQRRRAAAPEPEECPTCIGVGRIRDGETDELRVCLDCGGSGLS